MANSYNVYFRYPNQKLGIGSFESYLAESEQEALKQFKQEHPDCEFLSCNKVYR